MTEIIDDYVDVDMQIGTTRAGVVDTISDDFEDDAMFWDIAGGDFRVEMTQAASPNFVKGYVLPQKEYIDDINKILSPASDETDSPDDASSDLTLPNNGISKLVGSHFRLEVDNGFVTVAADESENSIRELSENVSEDVEEDRLLFNGRLANISPVGTNVYEMIAYDPGQQAFNIGNRAGSIMNQKLDLTGTEVGFRDPEKFDDNNVTGDRSVTAIRIIREIIEQAGIGDRSVILEEDFDGGLTGQTSGYIAGAPGQSNTAGPVRIDFKKLVVPVEKALNSVREKTNTEWWFDKNGTFYAGDPSNPDLGDAGSQVYEVKLISDTSAGITTPPYQSVRVVGRGVASTEGYPRNSQIQDEDDALVIEANIGLPSASKTQGGEDTGDYVIELNPDELQEPTFKYINAEIGTDEQLQNTALKVCSDLISQQGEGKVTVVGMPEIEPFDGILMPNSTNQPMGGQLYDVYSVIHKLNPSDGFKTEITVAGPNPRIRSVVDIEGDDLRIVAASGDISYKAFTDEPGAFYGEQSYLRDYEEAVSSDAAQDVFDGVSGDGIEDSDGDGLPDEEVGPGA